MSNISGNRVISGTYGEIWIDGDYVAEATAAQAKIAFTKEAVSMVRDFMEKNKITGAKGTGTVTMHRVFSRMGKKLEPLLKNHQDVRFTILLTLNDPDAYGAERIALKDVCFDDLLLADWANGKVGTIEAPFTFSGYEYLQSIEVPSHV